MRKQVRGQLGESNLQTLKLKMLPQQKRWQMTFGCNLLARHLHRKEH